MTRAIAMTRNEAITRLVADYQADLDGMDYEEWLEAVGIDLDSRIRSEVEAYEALLTEMDYGDLLEKLGIDVEDENDTAVTCYHLQLDELSDAELDERMNDGNTGEQVTIEEEIGKTNWKRTGAGEYVSPSGWQVRRRLEHFDGEPLGYYWAVYSPECEADGAGIDAFSSLDEAQEFADKEAQQ